MDEKYNELIEIVKEMLWQIPDPADFVPNQEFDPPPSGHYEWKKEIARRLEDLNKGQ